MKVSELLLSACLAFFIFISYSSLSESEEQQTNTVENLSLPQVIKSIPFNSSYTFAGERVPIENHDIKERLDRELTVNSYRHSSTILNIKASQRYFPEIERILAEENVPDDFKYLAVAESALQNVTSPAGAKGIWQFMKGTGVEYGLEINSEIDERYHLEKSTRAACKYLKKYKEKLGSWTLAAAAYNMGYSRTKSSLETQKMRNYYELNINQETSRYLFRILAFKEILSNPEKFGFYIDSADRYQPMDQFYVDTVDGNISNWGDYANEKGISYRSLKVYNPWLMKTSLSNSRKKSYLIKIPRI